MIVWNLLLNYISYQVKALEVADICSEEADITDTLLAYAAYAHEPVRYTRLWLIIEDIP